MADARAGRGIWCAVAVGIDSATLESFAEGPSMKKALVTFVLGFLCCAGLFAALSYHFVLTSGDKTLIVEKKGELGFSDTFVDTRKWGLADWLKNPRIGAIVAKHGIKSLLDTDGASKEAREAMEKSRKALDEGLEKLQEKVRKY